jgi:hypothetical protein
MTEPIRIVALLLANIVLTLITIGLVLATRMLLTRVAQVCADGPLTALRCNASRPAVAPAALPNSRSNTGARPVTFRSIPR